MARFNDSNVPAAIQPHLQPDEQLKHWAFGVRQPNIFLVIALISLAILPGVIAVALLTKNYIVALTDRRFLVLRFTGKLKIQEIMEYRLGTPAQVTASTGPIFTHVKIADPTRPFVAKFHRAGMPNNRLHSMAIAAALQGN